MMGIYRIAISAILAHVASACYVISKPPVGRSVLVRGSKRDDSGPVPEHIRNIRARLAALAANRPAAVIVEVASLAQPNEGPDCGSLTERDETLQTTP